MTEKIVQFADFAIKARQRRMAWDKDRCEHKHLELDDNGDLVLCLDCKTHVSAYWALRSITEKWGEASDQIKRQREQLQRQASESVHLIAARKVERAWRSKHMVPTCPHCRVPILPTDGFGGSMVNKCMLRSADPTSDKP